GDPKIYVHTTRGVPIKNYGSDKFDRLLGVFLDLDSNVHVLIHKETFRNFEHIGSTASQFGREIFITRAFRIALLYSYLRQKGFDHAALQAAGVYLSRTAAEDIPENSVADELFARVDKLLGIVRPKKEPPAPAAHPDLVDGLRKKGFTQR